MTAAAASEIRLADDLEAAASRDLYAAAPPSLGVRVEQQGGATLLLAPAIATTYFNRVIGLGQEPVNAAALDEVIARYRAASVADFWIHLSPGPHVGALQGWLERRGFGLPARRSWAKFLRPCADPPRVETALRIRSATPADAAAVGTVICQSYGMPGAVGPWFGALIGRPGWHWYVAQAGARIVACGALFVCAQGGWLGVGATLAEFRQQGAQGALLATRIGAAASLRCEVLATETGEPKADEKNPSLDNIRRSGFRQVASRLNFAAPQR